jgi:Zn-dependent membrane protease YugP
MLAFPLFFIGLLFNIPGVSGTLMDIGIFFFTGAVLFQVVTLPVEFDASKRALAQLTSSGVGDAGGSQSGEEGARRGGSHLRRGRRDGGAPAPAPP